MGRKLILVSTKPIPAQRVENMMGSAKESVETRECRQRERETCLHVFHYSRLFRGNKIVDCTVLREMNLTAWGVWSYRALNSKLYELGEQERRDTE